MLMMKVGSYVPYLGSEYIATTHSKLRANLLFSSSTGAPSSGSGSENS